MSEADGRNSPLVLARTAGVLGLAILAAGTFASSVFGRLGVYRAGYLPRVLGAIGHAQYVAHAAELALILWLLVEGVDAEAWGERARRGEEPRGPATQTA